ncbi:MAG: hypothetical protein K6G03_04690 [Lachnospiraceae bacterium]|nr:hypothetical protein [Lachnospiraceae bacterium]
MEASWTFEYKRETDRAKRKEILERAKAEYPDGKDVEIRERLWGLRYDVKNGYEVDYFIRGFINLQALKRNTKLPGEKNRKLKEIEYIKKDWQFELCRDYGETGENALYDELFNTTLLYIDFCKKDRNYNSILLGIGRIAEDRQRMKIINEIYEVAETIPENIGVKDLLQPFSKAAKEALGFEYPDWNEDNGYI